VPRALLALAIGAFGIGTTEFVVMGMLPEIGDGLGVSVSAVGLLISAYAVGVVVGAPTLTALGLRFTPRQTLVALMVVFVVGNVLASIAPSYEMLVGARVLTALSHGSFFGVGAVAARRLVPPEKATQSISLMITGLTVANVIGVPLGTLVAQHSSWRLVFAGIALIGLVTIAGLLAWMPGDRGEPADLRAELVAFRRGQVWLVLGLTMVGFAAMFAVYSYVSPILTELGGIPTPWVTPVLALFGIGTTIGTLAGGRLGDRYGFSFVAVGLVAMARRPGGLRAPRPHTRGRRHPARALRDHRVLPRPRRPERRHRGGPGPGRQSGLGGQPGRVQRGQRARGRPRRPRHLLRPGLHRADVGRRSPGPGGRGHRGHGRGGWAPGDPEARCRGRRRARVATGLCRADRGRRLLRGS
jgi:MFS family permease